MQDKKVCISIEEARKMLGIGRNLMLELIKVDSQKLRQILLLKIRLYI